MLRAFSTLLMISISTVAFAQEDFKSADSQLNTLYKEITQRLAGNAETLHLLTTAQRAWITFRDAECVFAASGVEDGSAYPEVLSSCKAGLTEKRIADFKAYLSCEEGARLPRPGQLAGATNFRGMLPYLSTFRFSALVLPLLGTRS